MRHSHPHPNSVRRILAGLGRRVLESLGSEPGRQILRRLHVEARRLEIRSPNGQPYSGVLAVEANRVVTGLAVPVTGRHHPVAGDAPVTVTGGSR